MKIIEESAISIPVPGEGFHLAGVQHGEPPGGGDTAGAVLVCHPHPAFGGDMEVPLVVAVCRELARCGLWAVRFDFRGIGRSGGRPTGGEVEMLDVLAALRWMHGRGAAAVHLAGYSFGALMSLAAASLAHDPTLAPTLLDAPVPPERCQGIRVASLAAVALPTHLGGMTGPRLRAIRAAAEGGCPMLLLAGDRDRLCRVDWLREHLVAGCPAIRVQVLPDQDHFFGAPEIPAAVDAVRRFVVSPG